MRKKLRSIFKATNQKSNRCALVFFCVICFLTACHNSSDNGDAKKAVFVKASIDSRGRFRKAHVRMPVSTKKNAIKNQNRSRYYYQTKGKYKRKKKGWKEGSEAWRGIPNRWCKSKTERRLYANHLLNPATGGLKNVCYNSKHTNRYVFYTLCPTELVECMDEVYRSRYLVLNLKPSLQWSLIC